MCGIDKTDFLILKCLDEAGQPLWKNKLHECQLSMFDKDVSVQTVGRRVDRMHDAGLLKSCIVSPDDINRDLIIAFKITEEGREELQQKRREILLEAIKPALFAEDRVSRPVTKEELVDLMGDELQLDTALQQELYEGYSWEELTTLLTMYFVKDQIDDVFSEERLNGLANLAADCPELANTVSYSILDAEDS